jgi:hypothetical protein
MTAVIRQEVAVKLELLCSCNNLDLCLGYFRSDSRSGFKIAARKMRLLSERFRPLLVPPSFLMNGYRNYILRLQRLGVNLTTHFYLEMRLKMNGNILLIPLCALVIWMKNTLFCPGLRSVLFSLSKRTLIITRIQLILTPYK